MATMVGRQARPKQEPGISSESPKWVAGAPVLGQSSAFQEHWQELGLKAGEPGLESAFH